MALTLTDRHGSLLCLLQLAFLLRAVSSAETCENVFKGFSACLLSLGENVANYPQDLDELENLHTICSYWNEFLSCTSAAVADCHYEAVQLWETLKGSSGSLNFRGNLVELCSKDNAASGLQGLTWERIICAMTLSNLLMWVNVE